MSLPVYSGLNQKAFNNHKSLICNPVFYLTIILVSLIAALTPRNAIAVPPDISGTYSGNISGIDICVSPSIGGPFVSTLTFTITQNSGNFSGSGSFIDDGGETGTFTFSGIVDDGGVVSSGNINIQSVTPGTGTFTGTFSGGQLSLSFIVQDVGYPDPGKCASMPNGTFNRTSGADVFVDPEITPSSVLTTPVLLNSNVKAITGDLNTRIGDVLRGIAVGPRQTATGFMWQGQSGLNAGDRTVAYGAWGSYSYSDFENDFVSTAYDGHRHNVLAGFDIIPWENTVFGLAVGYEGSDIDTGFNRGNQETDGFTIAPYFGYLFTDTWSVDASVGYSRVNYDQFRTDPGTGARITSSPDADRWFGTLNVNGFTRWNNWLVSGRIGLLHARNIQDSFIESNGTVVPEFTNKLGQWNVGGEAAYSYGEFEPFARVTYERDFSMTTIAVIGGPQPSNDNDNFLFGAGLRYFRANGLSANLEWNKRLGRDDFDEDTITATARWDF